MSRRTPPAVTLGQALFALAVAAGPAAGPAAGQGIYADLPRPHPHPVPTPRPAPPPSPTRLILERQRIHATVGDLVAEWRVEQEFRNPSSSVLEGVYLFPIPRDAVARGVSLWIDGKEVAGEVLDADQARGVYRDIVRKMRDPALLEYVDAGLLRASIFPVPARGAVRVALEFASSPARRGDVSELTLPLRFAAEAGAEVVVDVALETARPLSTVYSPTHDVDVARDGAKKARVSYEGRPTGPGDFRLYFASDDGPLGMSLLSHHLPASPGTFALVLSPRIDAAQETTPRDVVFTLDRSGSMAGEKWTQAVAALRYGLSTLREGDRFAIVSFATDVRLYKDGILPATDEELAGARAHLDALRPAGGTQIAGALETSLDLLEAEDRRLKLVAFLTDGLPTIGEVEPEKILAAAKARSPHARVFPFGVGYDVNTLLLDRVAEDHRGASDYVHEGEDLELPLAAFFDRIREPVLIAPELAFHGVEVFDVYPQRLPDLFAGSALVVVGRYTGEGEHSVVLRGRSFGGEQRSFTAAATFAGDAREPRALPALWASRKVGFLLNEIRLHGASKELVDQVVALGREHGIVTPYTAGLVVEEGMALGASTGVLRDRATPPGPSGPGTPGAGGAPHFRRPADAPAAEASARRELEELDVAGRARDAFGKKAVDDSLNAKRLAEVVAGDEVHSISRVGGVEVERLTAAGRRLFRVAGVVVDAAFTPAMREGIREVETYSDAWFALLDDDPALRELLALGEEVLFVTDGHAIWVHP